ncbi:RagB/SusD family nutrient uptake outer membrane protein [Sphingobacterium deserti]|uniref:RagB/SusD domain-containing protein n=1 Tax=Sphingobacterium deserti TaxID=1229276 RepID=A0A0B8T0U9_9SPHI|nr:RagB/SusD family nutrient uptake outer membrane protein [Sphingobacterium deserti]KGE14121.1 outer hypothetical protein, probably involved in nutrient binding [Sphingobacterium deserti]
MKFKYVRVLTAILGVAITSCDVERLPFDLVETGLAFQSVRDAGNWRNRLYGQMRGNFYGSFTFPQDVQADQLNATSDYGNRNGGPHRWTFLADDGTISNVWSLQYNALTNINTMLRGFGTINPANTEEAALLELYKGEAHFARAFYYHSLVVRYAKMYDPSTASADLGVPVVLVPDLDGNPARATVTQVYDQILSDIDEAKSRLQGVAGSAGSIRFTIDAVIALEARVKLYMQDWAGAKVAAEILINSGTYRLYSTADDIKNMWHIDLTGEDILNLAVSAPNELPNANSIYLGYNAAQNLFSPDFMPSQWVVDNYAENDYRKNAYFLNTDLLILGALRSSYWVVNKYPGNPVLFTSNVTNYTHKPKVFRIAETYLTAAEASFKVGNEADALIHLNALRVSRGLSAVNVSGAVLFGAIKEERMKELAFEGFRLDDLRRWGEGFTRREPQSTEFIQTGPEFNTKTVTANDPKFIWGIPERDRTVNPNIVQNEGW